MSKVHLVKKDSHHLEMSVKVDRECFTELFKISEISDGRSFNKLAMLGGDKAIAQQLGVDIEIGVTDDQKEYLRTHFGANIPVDSPLTPIYKFVLECLSDTMIQILLVAAVASTAIGMIQHGAAIGWVEGATIFFAVFIITCITTVNNCMKERQFKALRKKFDEGNVQVKRNGKIIQLDQKDLVVGDILLFTIGDEFKVDGLILSGSEVKIDESAATGESDEIKKLPFDEISEEHKTGNNASIEGPQPFLISGTKVVDGTGTMLVLAGILITFIFLIVGEWTCQGQIKKLLEVENPPTPLQQKLESVAEDIGKLGTLIAILVFLALIIHYSVNCVRGSEEFLSMETLSTFVNAFMIGVTIIVVAVPEGLPLAVTITLAFSVNRMKDEQNLVKTLPSCEIMGGANNICSDKTGTLTQNKMSVVELFIENIKVKRVDQKPRCANLLAQAILCNSTPYPPRSKIQGQLEQVGNKTDCALIQLTYNWGFELSHFRPSNNILKIIPFNSSRKKMITCFYDETKRSLMIHVKGASELVLKQCTKQIIEDSSVKLLSPEDKDRILNEIINKYASQTYRTVAIAYKEIDDIKAQGDPIQAYKDWLAGVTEEYLEKDLTLIGIAGIQDPLRPDVKAAIEQCKRSGITVRMVTGDNLLTAQAIARECGILDKHVNPSENRGYEILEGQEFRSVVGGLKAVKTKEGKEVMVVKDLYRFQLVAKDLKVLARASPEDKFLLVTGLIELDNVVAVTGDGTNDAPALRKADVGFAMGIAGSDVAKDAADIILLDDNFSSIVTGFNNLSYLYIACKWGRNIYNCIRKFIQFQLTVNIVALFMSVLGAVILTQSPLNTIQMLWVNLIMDTFASLALATEPPSMEVLNKPPYGRRENIVSAVMYRTIFGQSLYQIIVLCFLLFGFQHVTTMNLGQPDDFTENQKELYPSNVILLSIFFQTFVLMQIFNSVTCRKLEEKSLNPFANLCNNWMFWFIQTITLIVQYLLIQFGGKFVTVVPLTLQQQGICLAFAFGGLIIGVFVRLIPARIFRKIQFFKETQLKEEEMDHTLTSKLRRKSSVRLRSSQVDSVTSHKRSLAKHGSLMQQDNQGKGSGLRQMHSLGDN